MPDSNKMDNEMETLLDVDPKAVKEPLTKLDYLIHQVFCEQEAGRELLKYWIDSIMLMPTAQPGMDNIAIGIEEGKKWFIRGINKTIERVNNE